MPPAGGKRTPLTQPGGAPIASYTWGGWGTQNDITQFREVFQPDQGIFSNGSQPALRIQTSSPYMISVWQTVPVLFS